MLMIVFAVTPQLCLHPLQESGKAVPMPFLQGVTGERIAGLASLVRQNGNLMHEMGMQRPAIGTASATSHTCSTFNQMTTASSHIQTSSRSFGF
jgi:hypothetical protein